MVVDECESAITWEWLAGFTDGDGCISIIRNSVPNGAAYVRIRWTQKAFESNVLEVIAEFLQISGITQQVKSFTTTTKGHRYPQAELTISKQKDVHTTLWKLLPHLVIKGDKAVEGLILLDEIEQLHQVNGKYIRKRNSGGWHRNGPREKDRVR